MHDDRGTDYDEVSNRIARLTWNSTERRIAEIPQRRQDSDDGAVTVRLIMAWRRSCNTQKQLGPGNDMYVQSICSTTYGQCVVQRGRP